MRLLLLRHAIAEERTAFAATGKADRLRPLTDEGRKKMQQGRRGARDASCPSSRSSRRAPTFGTRESAEILAQGVGRERR